MIKIAIVGTGGMANAHANHFKQIPGCKLVAGVDIDAGRVAAFAKEHGIAKTFTSVQELIRDCDFDAASVVTPDAFHVACALPLVKAGKHVLCEKPLAPEAKAAKKLVTAAKKSGVINMVNFSYRNSSALHKIHQLVSAGKLGRIMHFEAHYLQTWLTSAVWADWRKTPAWLWRLSTKHGSKGTLGDIGVHITDLASYAANEDIVAVNGQLKTFSKEPPKERIGEYVLDANDSSFMRVELSGGGMGTISTTRWATGQTNSLALSLYGDKGAVRLDLDKSYDSFEACMGRDVKSVTWKTVTCKKTPNMWQRFIKSIKTGHNDAADFERGWQIQKALDACIKSDETGRTVKSRS